MDHHVRQLERESAETPAGRIIIQRKAQSRQTAVRIGAASQRKGSVAQNFAIQRIYGDQLIGDNVGIVVEHERPLQAGGIDAENPDAQHGEED